MYFCWIVRDSRSFSVGIVEQAAESFPPDQRAFCGVIVGWLDQRTVKTLMRALYVVMNHVLADEFSEVRLAGWDDAVEALCLPFIAFGAFQ